MSKVLVVLMECGRQSNTVYLRVADDATEQEVQDLAKAAFHEWADYGYSIVDESDVPSDVEIQG